MIKTILYILFITVYLICTHYNIKNNLVIKKIKEIKDTFYKPNDNKNYSKKSSRGSSKNSSKSSSFSEDSNTENIMFTHKHIINDIVINEFTDILPKDIEQNAIIPSLNTVTPSLNVKSPPYGPIQIRSCYNVKNYAPINTNAPIIAIIGCYYNPKLQSDFDVWTKKFGLPQKNLNIINLALPENTATGYNTGWYLEVCMDVQAVYTISPNSNITVVIAKSPSIIDILNAIIRANQLGASVVSMSFGSSSEGYFFESFFNSSNCCYLASSGDDPFVNYPSSSPNVISVGGSSLYINDIGNNNFVRNSETTWSSAGLGISKYFSQPAYQKNIPALNNKKRATPDIVSVANPSTGFIVYCSNYDEYKSGWYQVGGTSLSCPLVAGLISNANILRKNANKKTLSSVGSSGFQVQTFMYNIYKNKLPNFPYKNNFYDVTIGYDGIAQATTGYDLPTSLGVPDFDVLTNSLFNGIA